jgi:hypothetical protein
MYIAQSKNISVLVLLAFHGESLENGGSNRSTQIFELLVAAGFTLRRCVSEMQSSRFRVALSGLQSWARYGGYRPLCLESLRVAGRTRRVFENALEVAGKIDAVLIEGTGFGVLSIIPWLKNQGYAVFLAPANIEALVPYVSSWTHRNSTPIERFTEELRWMRHADHVFTVSPEEAWLLSINGIRASVLPYYPPSEVLKRLLLVKSKREPDENVGYLYLADFNNAPNRIGLRALLGEWRNLSTGTLTIAGRGIELVKNELQNSDPGRVRVAGSISSNDLDSLRQRCTSMVIIHPATSGMLTRVIECNISGIPIVGNLMALKSYMHLFSGWQFPPDRRRVPKIVAAVNNPVEEVSQFIGRISGAIH